MAAPFFSVVVPVYNVEAYIEQSLHSIFDQSFRDVEFILVDDCSSDASGQLCDDFASRDLRVRVIHLACNGGVSAARNTGMNAATGSYLIFFDPDDIIEQGFFTSLHDAIVNTCAQVVLWGAVEEYYHPNGECVSTALKALPAQHLVNEQEVRAAFMSIEESTLFGYPWNKAYNLAFLRASQASFAGEALLEDFFFNVRALQFCSHMLVLPDAPYHYARRIKVSSLTEAYLSEYFELHERRVKTFYDLHNAWGILTQDVRGQLGAIYLRYCLSALERNCDKRANMTHRMRKDWLELLYSHELYKELVPFAAAKGGLARAFEARFKAKNTRLLLFGARIVHIMKSYAPSAFTRAQHSR